MIGMAFLLNVFLSFTEGNKLKAGYLRTYASIILQLIDWLNESFILCYQNFPLLLKMLNEFCPWQLVSYVHKRTPYYWKWFCINGRRRRNRANLSPTCILLTTADMCCSVARKQHRYKWIDSQMYRQRDGAANRKETKNRLEGRH